MIKQLREDCEFLLKSNPDEFDLNELKDAIILLSDTIDDMDMQATIPRELYQGENYDKWRLGLLFKMNKVKSARRRFSGYYSRVKEETELNLLKSLCRSYIEGNEGALTAIKNMVM